MYIFTYKNIYYTYMCVFFPCRHLRTILLFKYSVSISVLGIFPLNYSLSQHLPQFETLTLRVRLEKDVQLILGNNFCMETFPVLGWKPERQAFCALPTGRTRPDIPACVKDSFKTVFSQHVCGRTFYILVYIFYWSVLLQATIFGAGILITL